MRNITVSEAFGNAPPRSIAVLCVKSRTGGTDLLRTEWFSWLNIKRNPMISFSLSRYSEIGKSLREGDSLILAFPGETETAEFREPVSVDAEGCAEGNVPETIPVKGEKIRVPKGSTVVLHCTLAGAYNYPFKKIRIFNCNLEDAAGNI